MLYKTKFTKGLALLMAGAVLMAGCGKQENGGTEGAQGTVSGTSQENGKGSADGSGENTGGSGSGAMGRYTDSTVELPEKMVWPWGLVWDGETIRAVDQSGADFVSADGGATFQYDNSLNESYRKLVQDETYISSCAVNPQGARLVVSAVMDGEDDLFYYKNLYTPDNQVLELNDIPKDQRFSVYCGDDGWFYGSDKDGRIYRIDPQTGEMTFLFQNEDFTDYLTVAGGILYAMTNDGIQLFDLEKKQIGDQDPVLNDLLKEEIQSMSFGGYPSFQIVQGRNENSIYVLTKAGVYHHAVYGNVMEQVIDGSLCSIGDASKSFAGMVVLPGEEQDSFLILYSDGTLMRYNYDASIPTVPEKTLRVYSMYDNQNVRLAVSAYQQKNRDVYVKYEVGVSEANGMTPEDALKNLSTELAAGKGPDVLLMDNLPYDSYVEKGVLADLGGLVSAMQQEDPLFENVVETYRREKGLYTIPMTFSIPAMAGEGGAISGLKTLADLADLMESTRQKQPAGSLMNFGTPIDALSILAQASAGAWVKEDKSLDRQAVTEFLTQAKRIYDAQMSGIGEKEIQMLSESNYGRMDNKGLTLYENYLASTGASTSFYLNQPFSAGILRGTVDDLGMYLSSLRIQEQQYIPMPGQQQNVCIPSSLLGINQASAEQEAAEKFVKYAVSGEYQGSGSLTGCPINRAGYEAIKEFPYGDGFDPETQAYAIVSAVTEDGRSETLEIFWPGKEDIAKFDELLEGLSQAGSCDDRVYAAVLELGAGALAGDTSVEEAVNAIEKKVQLYLAE